MGDQHQAAAPSADGTASASTSAWAAAASAASLSSPSASTSALPLPSPCLVHAGLYKPTQTPGAQPHHHHQHHSGYFDSHNEDSDDTVSRRKHSSRSKSSRRREAAAHRGPRGAAEPESEDDEGHHHHHHRQPPRIRRNNPANDDASSSSAASSSSSYSSSMSGTEDEDDKVRSLTRQLAETAVGVREMSKQLGRARVKSTIKSVLIITKAKDNDLIQLTRELALWLMLTPRTGSKKGIIVYVDSQLKKSKRFDANGIQRDHPQLFEPISSGEASSSNTSSASPSSQSSAASDTSSGNPPAQEGQLRYWTADMCSRSPHLFDFVVTLGGDGTVLFCSWLFQRVVPPVIPFALGSLGFLTNFDFSDHPQVMSSAIDQGIRVNLRMRFTATVFRATMPPKDARVDKQRRRAIKSGRTGEIIMRNVKEGGWDTIEKPQKRTSRSSRFSADHDDGDTTGASTQPPAHVNDREVMCFSTRPVETFEVLNDLVVDRGPSPYVSQLEVFGDEHHMTTAQADGLCISTPTGSTAYSLSAGGSLVHPEIPAILITPICPHTLSFRPMLLPDSMELRIAVPYNSRSTAWASFDGRGRVELRQGDHIKVTASRYPFPTVCKENQSTDWFQSISRTLKWNERQRQKSFVVVEEDAEDDDGKKASRRSRSKRSSRSKTSRKDDMPDAAGSKSSSSRQAAPSTATPPGLHVDQRPHSSARSDDDRVHAQLSGPGKMEAMESADAEVRRRNEREEQASGKDSDGLEEDDTEGETDDVSSDAEEAFDIDDVTATNTPTCATPAPADASPAMGHPRRSASSTTVGGQAKRDLQMSSSVGSLDETQPREHSHYHHHHHRHHTGGHSRRPSGTTRAKDPLKSGTALSRSAPGSHRNSFDRLSRLVPFSTSASTSTDANGANGGLFAPAKPRSAHSRGSEEDDDESALTRDRRGDVDDDQAETDRIEFDAPPGSHLRFREQQQEDEQRRRRRHHSQSTPHSQSLSRRVSGTSTPQGATGGPLGQQQRSETPSILDSPGRFSAAGPPAPPRAISERHLTTADFRMTGRHAGGEEENGRGGDGSGSGSGGDGADSAVLPEEGAGGVITNTSGGSLQQQGPFDGEEEGAMRQLKRQADKVAKKQRKRASRSEHGSGDGRDDHQIDDVGEYGERDHDDDDNGGDEGAASNQPTALIVLGDDESSDSGSDSDEL